VPEAGKQATAAVSRAAATEVEVPQTAKVVAVVAEAVVAPHPEDREVVSVASVASVADEAVVAEDGDLSEVVRRVHLHQREASHKHHDAAASLLPSPPLIPPSSSLLMQHAVRQVFHSFPQLAPLVLRTP
jgi:hypothetical protein